MGSQKQEIVDLRGMTAFACTALGFLMGLMFLVLYDGRLKLVSGLPSSEIVMEYKDLVSIILTALGVMIALLSVGLAVAAVWGYKEIKENTANRAKETIMAQLKEDGELWPLIEKTLLEVAQKTTYSGLEAQPNTAEDADH